MSMYIYVYSTNAIVKEVCDHQPTIDRLGLGSITIQFIAKKNFLIISDHITPRTTFTYISISLTAISMEQSLIVVYQRLKGDSRMAESVSWALEKYII